MSDIQRSIDLAAEIRRVDGNHSLGAAALAEALEPWLDAVVAAVREDLICGPVGAQLIENGRAAAARDIRADGADSCAEYYARIAEGGNE